MRNTEKPMTAKDWMANRKLLEEVVEADFSFIKDQADGGLVFMAMQFGGMELPVARSSCEFKGIGEIVCSRSMPNTGVMSALELPFSLSLQVAGLGYASSLVESTYFGNRKVYRSTDPDSSEQEAIRQRLVLFSSIMLSADAIVEGIDEEFGLYDRDEAATHLLGPYIRKLWSSSSFEDFIGQDDGLTVGYDN